MQAPVDTPVIEKKAKDLMVSEMIVVNGVTCQIITVIPHIEGAPFVTISVTAEGLREWEQVMLNIPAEQTLTVAMPACSGVAIAQTKAMQNAIAKQQEVVEAQAQAQPAPEQQQQKKPVGPVQFMDYNAGYMGYL